MTADIQSLSAQLQAKFDPFAEDFAANPYPLYATLRALPEPFYYAPMNAYLLARYEDVEHAARQPQMLRSLDHLKSSAEIEQQRQRDNRHDMPNHQRFVQFSLLETDGAVHQRLRRLVLREFSKTFIERHRSMIAAYVNALLDQLLEQREVDFVADLAAHVPGHIIGNVLGVPDADCPQLRIWSENVVQFFDVDRSAAHKQLAEQATTEFYHYLLDLIAHRRKYPAGDLLSTLVAAQQAGELNQTELISTSMLMLMAGHGSTIDVLGTGLLALLQHPEQLARLQAQPGLIATAIQEMFRYDSPLPFFHRYAAEPVSVMGREYPAGTKFGLLYGSANRDPAYFAHADRFDVGRTPNRHVAFGRGAHLCLGNNLSRLDMEIIFSALLRRCMRIELREAHPTFRPGLVSRGLQRLRLELVE